MKQKRKTRRSFGTVYTVLITLLFAAIAVVAIYAWNILGFSAHSVSYSSTESDVVGIIPEKREFAAGDEVVVRAGTFSREGYTFAGWKDSNGAIESKPEILENGAVFIMPDADVVLEPVWEVAESAPEADDSEKKSSDKKSSEKSGVTVFTKKESKDYINIRSTYGYDGEVVTKVSDNSTELEYSGKSESIYDEDDLKTYTWYYVSIPSKDKEGWVRSDMLSGGESDADDKDGDSYVKSEEYDSVALRESADADAEVRAEVEDDETELIFTGKTKESEDKNGKTTVWYYVKDSSTGSSGWVEKSKLRHVS